jgi:hypothetical protein
MLVEIHVAVWSKSGYMGVVADVGFTAPIPNVTGLHAFSSCEIHCLPPSIYPSFFLDPWLL